LFERYSVIGVAFALAIILLDFYLLKKRRIQGRSFALWFTIGVVLALFSTVPFLYSLLMSLYGTQEAISAVTATAFLFFLLMLLYLHTRISELQSLLMKLAMEISLIKHDREQVEQESTKVKSENTKKRKDKNERKTSRSRRKTSV